MIKEIKDIIEGIIKGAGIFITGQEAQKKKKLGNLSKDLNRIALLLDKANAKLKKREIPKEEAVRLDILISYAAELATPFYKKYPKLAEVFNALLPEIATQMQLADYVIDGKLRRDAPLSGDKENIQLSFTPEDQLKKAYQELKNASNAIKEHSRKFGQMSK